MPDSQIIEKGIFKNKFFNKTNENNYTLKTQEEFEKVIKFYWFLYLLLLN